MYYVVYCTYTCTYIDVLFIHTWKTVVVALSLLLFVLLIEAMAVKSRKYYNFFKGEVGEKDVTDLPGIYNKAVVIAVTIAIEVMVALGSFHVGERLTHQNPRTWEVIDNYALCLYTMARLAKVSPTVAQLPSAPASPSPIIGPSIVTIQIQINL